MMKRVAVLPGVSKVTQHAASVMRDISRLDLKFEVFEGTGLLTDSQLGKVSECDGALFGSVSGGASSSEYVSPIIDLRKRLNLSNILYSVDDLVLVREGTEDTSDESLDNGVAVSHRQITRDACESVARFAFELAESRRLGDDVLLDEFKKGGNARVAKVTIAHKANVFAVTEGLFRDTVLEVAQEFPDVVVEEKKADSVACELVVPSSRRHFDVIVATNLFGDILGDVCAGVQGGLSYSAAASVSNDGFILAHSSDIVAASEAPFGSFRAAALLLGSMGDRLAANSLDRAISHVMLDPEAQQGTLQEISDRIVVRCEYESHQDDISQE